MSQEGNLTCKKCDAPLILDDSLKKVNLTQLSRLVSKRQHEQQSQALDIINELNPQDYIPQDRLELYEYVNSKNNIEPIQYRNYLESEDEEEEEDDDDEQAYTHNDGGEVMESSSDNSYLVVLEESDEEVIERDEINKQEGEEREIRISSRIKNLTKIFEILSNNQDIDHPLSEDCANLLIENYKLKFDQSQKEKDSYLSFLRKLKDKDNQLKLFEEGERKINPELFREDLDKKLKESIEEFQRLTTLEEISLQELKGLEKTKEDLETELKQYTKELEEIETKKLNEILQLKNKLQLELKEKENKLEQSKAAYHVHLDHIDKLRNLNIYTKIFNISTDKDNKYGMINGFRIGYKVIRSEINAALGQIVLLLVFLIKRLNLKLDNYKLVPMGSQSQIVKFNVTNEADGEAVDNSGSQPTKSKTVLNLYSTDEFSLGKLFNFNKLDVAMISLLDIVSQIEARLMSLDPEIELPYKISSHKDAIGGKSIRVTSNAEWTQSCKFLLTNLNWMLSFISGHTSSE